MVAAKPARRWQTGGILIAELSAGLPLRRDWNWDQHASGTGGRKRPDPDRSLEQRSVRIRNHAAGAGLTCPPHTSPAAFPRRARRPRLLRPVPAHYRAASGGSGQSPGQRTEGQGRAPRTIVFTQGAPVRRPQSSITLTVTVLQHLSAPDKGSTSSPAVCGPDFASLSPRTGPRWTRQHLGPVLRLAFHTTDALYIPASVIEQLGPKQIILKVPEHEITEHDWIKAPLGADRW